MNNSPKSAAKGFTRAFWVSNTVELFERMAFIDLYATWCGPCKANRS